MRLLVLAAAAGGLAAAFLVPLREGETAATEVIRMPAYDASTTVSVHPAPGRPESSTEPADHVLTEAEPEAAPTPEAGPNPAVRLPSAPAAPAAPAPRLAPPAPAAPELIRRKPAVAPAPVRVLAQQVERPDDRPRRAFIPE